MFAAGIGTGEIIVIVAVVILLFGATKLPQLARSLGASAREFRKGVEEGSNPEDEDASAES
jgi:sec-independent protein translocase protein TatA